jgi:hypothetical protein
MLGLCLFSTRFLGIADLIVASFFGDLVLRVGFRFSHSQSVLRRIAFGRLCLGLSHLLLAIRLGFADILGVVLHSVAFFHRSLVLLLSLLLLGLTALPG